MRVLHIFSGRELGGISAVMLPLIGEIQNRGLEISILFLSDGIMVDKARELGLNVDTIRRRHGIDPNLIYKMAQKIKKEDIKIVHTHSIISNFYGRIASIFVRDIAVFTSVHADTYCELVDATGSKIKGGVLHMVDLYMERFSSLLLANSNATEDILLSKGIKKGKTRVVHNGILCDEMQKIDVADLKKRLCISVDTKVIGSVGRLTHSKNYPCLLRAAKLVLNKLPDTIFLIVGDGNQQQYLKNLAMELNIQERVLFVGWQDNVQEYIAAMDVFVLVSNKEGFGLVLLEAMIHGIPVIATAVGGMPEIVTDGENGILVQPDNEEELAFEIINLFKNPEYALQMGKRGEKSVKERFSIKLMADKMIDLYSGFSC